MMCEEKFDIEVTEEDANRFVTVGDVVAYLETL
jgi:acyl carrier protein